MRRLALLCALSLVGAPACSDDVEPRTEIVGTWHLAFLDGQSLPRSLDNTVLTGFAANMTLVRADTLIFHADGRLDRIIVASPDAPSGSREIKTLNNGTWTLQGDQLSLQFLGGYDTGAAIDWSGQSEVIRVRNGKEYVYRKGGIP